ncbi:MAG: GHKL domain-containing protein [Pedobacter sp.]|nr:MAG: GHKL domain-containing protein [Pedobacter sp.]
MPPITKLEYFSLGKKVTYFEDKSASLTLEQVKQLDKNGKFKAGKQNILNFGNTKSAFWIKLKYIPSKHVQNYFTVDAPNIENVDFYWFNSLGDKKIIYTGCLSKSEEDVYISSNFVFNLPIQEVSQENTIFLRVKTNNILMVPLKLSAVDKTMQGRIYKDSIEFIYIGILFALLVFNLFLFFSIKDVTYLHYTFYVLSLSAYLLLYIRGYSYLFGEDFRILANHYPHVFLSFSVFFSLSFCMKFLTLKTLLPKFVKLYYIAAFGGFVLLVVSLSGNKSAAAQIAQYLTITVSMLVWVSGIVAYFRGHKPAKYYVAAWSFIWITVAVVTLTLANLIDSTEFTMQLVPIGSTLELLLLSFALGDRYKVIIQTEQSVRDENLMLVRTQNQRLEENVMLRTLQLSKTIKELEASNAVKNKLFSIIAHDLRSPLNSLITILSLDDMDALTVEELRLMLKDNRQSIETIYNTLNNLLYWAKDQMTAVKTEPQTLHLNTLLAELMLIYQPLLEKKEIACQVSEVDNCFAYADINQIRLVLRNMIDNAFKFTPRGEKILINLKYQDEMVAVEISNPVIDSSKIDTNELLGLNITSGTYGTENEKGVGLGLQLCKEYVETNNGIFQINLKSGLVVVSFKIPKSENLIPFVS